MQLFEFGEYWNTGTFILILLTGCAMSFLAAQATTGPVVLQLGKSIAVRKENLCYGAIFLLLVFLYTFKDITFGADSGLYVQAFQASTVLLHRHNSHWEPLFNLLCYVVRLFTDNYTVFFFVSGLIVASGYVKFVKTFWREDCDFLFIVLLAQQFFYDMNIMRSGIGGAFILLSFCYLKDNQIKKALIASAIATLFQYTLVVNFGVVILYVLSVRNGKIFRKMLVRYELLALVSAIVTCFLVRVVIANTRYSYYLTEMQPTIIGNWSVFLSVAVTAVTLILAPKDDFRLNVAVVAAMFSLIMVVPVLMLGAYRLTIYYYVPRLFVWGYSSKQLVSKSGINPRLHKALVIGAVLFFALFTISRRSVTPGFAYKLVDLFG